MMGVQNVGDILHVIILALILVWLFYHQWVITNILDLMRKIVEKMPDNSKESDKYGNRKDSDFKLKR